jgi:MFS family permease
MAKLISEEVPPSSEKSKKKFTRNIYFLYLISFLNGLQFITPVIVPFFNNWGGLSFSQIMVLQSIYYLTVVISEIPLGAVADLVSKRVSVSVSILLTLIAIIVYSSVQRFYVFVIGEICWGAAGALMSGADKSLLYDTLVKLEKEADTSSFYGKFDSFRILGLLISAPLGGLIASNHGERFAMIFMLIPVGAALITSVFVQEPYKNQKVKKNYFRLVTSGFRTIWKKKELKILIIDLLIIATLSSHIAFTYQQKLIQLGISQSHFGWISMVYMGSAILFSSTQKFFVKIFHSKKRVLFISSLGTGIGLVCLFFATSLFLIVFCIFLVAGLGLTYFNISLGYCQGYIDSEERSTVISTISMFRLLSLSIMNTIIGYVAEINLSIVFLALGVCAVAWSFLSPVKEKHLNYLKSNL